MFLIFVHSGKTGNRLLTFTGDTAVGAFLDHDFVRQSRAILIECTFFERDHIVRARAGRHIHVEDLPKLLAAIPDCQVILTHVTRRTDLRLAKRILKQTIGEEEAKRVSFLMDRPARRTGGVTAPRAQAEPRSVG